MSTTTTKRTYAHAMRDALTMRDLFERDAWIKWDFAGSLRRGKPDVGDIDHVVLPRFGDLPNASLFAEGQTNLLFARLDELLAQGEISKHVYRYGESGQPIHRWGAKSRGVDFRGFNHEFTVADALNWGSVLLIKTGPADFSRHFVDRFNQVGILRQMDGYLRSIGTGEITPVPDEASYFRLAGLPFLRPEERR
jgi:DNA polymerase/3'-5' exonuclease PolX